MTTSTRRTALVTGGSRGIGAATARRLAREGTDVVISCSSASSVSADAVVAELVELGVRARAVQADQGDPDQAAALVDTAVGFLGGLDVLVNAAGTAFGGPYDRAAVARLFAVNVTGLVETTTAALPHLPSGGRIVSVGSLAGHRNLVPGLADYSATKAAVAAYTRGWARDLGPRGITVNAVQPGAVDTAFNPADGPAADAQRAGTPLGRFAHPDEIAGAIAFLAGPDAAFITGAVLDVDGGMSL